MPRRWLADLRGHKTVILPIGGNARGCREQEGGDDYGFCHDPTLANEDRAEIALICLGFKRPTRSNVGETRSPFPANTAGTPKPTRGPPPLQTLVGGRKR